MERNLIAAIDIGTTKIVATIGRVAKENQIEVVAMASVPSLGVERGMVKHIDEASASIAKVLEKLNQKVQYQFSEVWVGIAGHNVKSVLNSSEMCFEDSKHRVTYQDIEFLLETCLEKQQQTSSVLVNIVPQSFELDNDKHTQNPLGMKTSMLKANFLLTLSKSNACDNINKSLEANGLKSKELVLESLASAKSILTEEEVRKGVVLIDIGGGTSDLAIFKDHKVVHSSVIPYGGEVITYDIMKAFGLDYRYAKTIKHQQGSALDPGVEKPKIKTINNEGKPIRIKYNDLIYTINARVEEIVNFIEQEIDISGIADKIECGIVLTGGGSLLRDLKQMFQFRFKDYDVKIASPRKHFFSGSYSENLNTPTYATVTGLLLTGLEKMNYENKKTKLKDKFTNEIPASDSENEEFPMKNKFNSFLKGIFKNTSQHDNF